ncbi:MAG: hypothetical protein Q8M54_07135 [Desulfobaccales bacterium]|nr:hypothetical protein [Desulfobaccales bacterium]
MDQEQVLKEAVFENYEWLSSGDKNTSALLPANFQEIGKAEEKAEEFVILTLSLPFNLNRSKKFLPPLIIAKFLLQPQYEISNSVDDKLEIFIAKSISKVPEVEYILLSKIENYYEIWTVINKLDRGVRERIYDIEFNILRTFKGLCFDFHVICRNDRDIKEFYSSNTKIIFQRMV